MKWSAEELDELISGIYDGSVTEYELPHNLYFAIADHLKDNLYKGFGTDYDTLKDNIDKGIESAFTSKDLELLGELRENIYMFSGAKTFNEVYNFRGALVNENGDIKKFKEFKADMLKLDAKYNKDWLLAEYNTAYGQGQSAIAWNQIVAKQNIFPYVRYNAVMDKNTSEICRPLDNVTLPVNHPFWKTHSPLNHFNCRCILEQLDETDAQVTNEAQVKEVTQNANELMSDVFKMNPGIDRVVFSKEHPYFEVEPKYKPLAKQNFNLPIPETDKAQKKLTPTKISEFAKEADKNIKSWGSDVNPELYKLLNKELGTVEMKKGSSHALNNKIYINTGERYQKSDFYKKSLIYHEVGHVIHEQNMVIDAYRTGMVSTEYAQHFKKLKSLLTDEDAKRIDWELSIVAGKALAGSAEKKAK